MNTQQSRKPNPQGEMPPIVAVKKKTYITYNTYITLNAYNAYITNIPKIQILLHFWSMQCNAKHQIKVQSMANEGNNKKNPTKFNVWTRM